MRNRFFVFVLCMVTFGSAYLNATEPGVSAGISGKSTAIELHSADIHFAKAARYLGGQICITKTCIKNNESAGFITYDQDGYRALDPVSDYTVMHGGIELLFVEEKYRRQGIGKALLRHALEDMRVRGIKVIVLHTQVTNVTAQALYEKLGFILQTPVTPKTPDFCSYRFYFS